MGLIDQIRVCLMV